MAGESAEELALRQTCRRLGPIAALEYPSQGVSHQPRTLKYMAFIDRLPVKLIKIRRLTFEGYCGTDVPQSSTVD